MSGAPAVVKRLPPFRRLFPGMSGGKAGFGEIERAAILD